jgi:hypothetical protein
MRDKDSIILENLYTSILSEAHQKNVELPSAVTPEETKNAFGNLSDVEKSQLGTAGFVSVEDWPRFRKFMLMRSISSNPLTDPDLCAYTPGETWNLFKNPVIQKWHRDIVSHKVPDSYDTVILVPCAKTKPWNNACRGIYKSYNRLKNEYGNLYFVTISEPLGIVPMDMWDDFPQYDNPGLFSDPVQRSGLFTADWKRLFGVDKRLKTPFDESLQKKCIEYLGKIIDQFLGNNSDKNILSFVEDFKGAGTHSQMLDVSGKIDKNKRFFKRGKEREEPYPYILSTLDKNRGTRHQN